MRRLRNQRGAVVVIVAIAMVALTGFTALAVDVGALWLDRKELQNGADAAALALAQSCAKGACEADEFAVANYYAAGNKRDANVRVTDIQHGTNTVKVTVASTRAHWFAPVLGDTQASTQISASATASWGGIGSAHVAPFTVSICHLTDILAGDPVTLILKGSKVDCQAGDPPHTVPGGMNWLETSGSVDCTAQTSVGNWIQGAPGNSGPNNSYCNDLLASLMGEEIRIPVFDEATGTGTDAQYHIAAYAILRIEAYCLNKGAGWYAGDQCTGEERFLRGTFIERVDIDAEGGGPDYGATTVQLTE